ncbi:MAG: type II toxin-antitoxin system VapC family toxin [Cellulomonadaceae bacterium]|jgi:predicted nucleic acid-binding protein|nr:type II toxin-antitoxin system VapC family toxin [Cellulomonadaceae bacterium]
MRVYIDTSAAVKLMKEEPCSQDMEGFANDPHVELVSSTLTETELRRAATRNGEPQERAAEVLSRISLAEITRADYRLAGILPGENLRSLDALHLQMASSLEADFVVTYDLRMINAALRVFGIPVIHPGFEPDMAALAGSTV